MNMGHQQSEAAAASHLFGTNANNGKNSVWDVFGNDFVPKPSGSLLPPSFAAKHVNFPPASTTPWATVAPEQSALRLSGESQSQQVVSQSCVPSLLGSTGNARYNGSNSSRNAPPAMARYVSDDNVQSIDHRREAVTFSSIVGAIRTEQIRCEQQIGSSNSSNNYSPAIDDEKKQNETSNNNALLSQPEKKTTKKQKGAVGRSGDPRMHAAVCLRLRDPKMPLIDALLRGGFAFPTLGQPGANDRNTYDEDGVLLYQRKNQLNRRIRQTKRKEAAGKAKKSGGSKGTAKKSRGATFSEEGSSNDEAPSAARVVARRDDGRDKNEPVEEVISDEFLGFLDAELGNLASCDNNLLLNVFDDDERNEQELHGAVASSSSRAGGGGGSQSPYQEALDGLSLRDIAPIPL